MTRATTPPDGRSSQGLCPWCGFLSSFIDVEQSTLAPAMHNMATTANARTRLLVFQCQGCNRGVLVVEERDDTESEFAPIHWWPSPEVEFELPESIPTEVLDSCAEAGRCLGVNAPNGAATMLRNTIALIVNDKGSDEAKTK